jgi:hypothetical protein
MLVFFVHFKRSINTNLNISLFKGCTRTGYQDLTAPAGKKIELFLQYMIHNSSTNFTSRGYFAKGIITKNLQFNSSKHDQVAEPDQNIRILVD